jgi:hypothetical protein
MPKNLARVAGNRNRFESVFLPGEQQQWRMKPEPHEVFVEYSPSPHHLGQRTRRHFPRRERTRAQTADHIGGRTCCRLEAAKHGRVQFVVVLLSGLNRLDSLSVPPAGCPHQR